MKNVPWEIFIPACMTVIGGLLLWAFRAMRDSLKKTITEDVQKEINDLKNRVSTNENNIKNNLLAAEEAKKRAEFLMQYLLEKKS